MNTPEELMGMIATEAVQQPKESTQLPRLDYEELVAQLQDQPVTFYPGLLSTVVEASYAHNVFLVGGASDTARNVERRIGKAAVWKTEHSDRLDAMITDRDGTWDLSTKDREMLKALRARLLNLEMALLTAPEVQHPSDLGQYQAWREHQMKEALE